MWSGESHTNDMYGEPVKWSGKSDNRKNSNKQRTMKVITPISPFSPQYQDYGPDTARCSGWGWRWGPRRGPCRCLAKERLHGLTGERELWWQSGRDSLQDWLPTFTGWKGHQERYVPLSVYERFEQGVRASLRQIFVCGGVQALEYLIAELPHKKRKSHLDLESGLNYVSVSTCVSPSSVTSSSSGLFGAISALPPQ